VIEKQPLISICIPTYNNARYLGECLDSIVSQSYPNIEVIVGDDGSSDGTEVILQKYIDRYGVRLHRNPVNRGAAATSSTLVYMARGKYVAVYHSDDRYEKTIVEESVNVLEADDSVGMVGTMANIIDEEGRYLREFHLHDALRKLNKNCFTFDEVMLGVLKNGGNDIMIVTPSVMVRKKAYQQLGLYTEKHKGIYDYEMWFRIATKYRVAIIDKKLMNYRVHEHQISERETKKSVDLQEIVLIVREYRRFIGSKSLRRYCNQLVDTWIFRAAKKQNYRGYYEKSNETLKLIGSRKYLLLRWLLHMLNTMKVSLKRRLT
jgi:glycosyltransferase involved in cell wall biosynthesis